jgi:anthranilate synthase/aminodeoxychorismate synthase-like glutamine amidotransferase
MLRRSVLLVDNHDSFTHNIAHALAACGARVDVMTVDDPRLIRRALTVYDAVVVGPGPGAPRANGALAHAVSDALAAGMPALGICLGMQAIGTHFGARVTRARRPVHGELGTLVHDGSGLFGGVPSPFRAMRYHSLCVAPSSLPDTLHVNAHSEDGVIQGIAHRERPVYGLQFHPESFLSEHGAKLLRNFIEQA